MPVTQAHKLRALGVSWRTGPRPRQRHGRETPPQRSPHHHNSASWRGFAGGAAADIGRAHGLDWIALKPELRRAGRFHVEVY